MRHWLKNLPNPHPLIVAEVKDKSPFGWINPFSRSKQFKICEEVGDIISIHTNSLWGGSYKWLKEARRLTHKPILAKGFHSTLSEVQKAFDYGADYVLTVGWYPGIKNCWFEPENLNDFEQSEAIYVVCNSRNPRTGKNSNFTIGQVLEVRSKWICQASNIKSIDDINLQVDAVLVGQSLYL